MANIERRLECAAGMALTVSSLLGLMGCQGNGPRSGPDDPPTSQSALTPGMAKRTIVKGQTNQQQVIEVFGPPDLVTSRGGTETWTYDKIRYEMQSSSGYLTVLLAGVGGESRASSSVSTMLIIYFNDAGVVQDYKLSRVKF